MMIADTGPHPRHLQPQQSSLYGSHMMTVCGIGWQYVTQQVLEHVLIPRGCKTHASLRFLVTECCHPAPQQPFLVLLLWAANKGWHSSLPLHDWSKQIRSMVFNKNR